MKKNEIVKLIEFWRESVKNKDLKSRKAINVIDYKSKEIVDLVGVRRCGKSSILGLVIKEMNLKDDFLFINFEDPFFIENNTPEIIEEIIEIFKEYFSKDLKYLFFDEIQEIKNWEREIRKLRDSERYKIFITGSSSKLLSAELSSLITGRHISYEIFPLSFFEFLEFRGIKIKNKKDLLINEITVLKNFEEYSKIGGFPEISLKGNMELLKNYFFDILEKDVVMRHNLREKEILEKIAVFLLTNSSKIISIKSLKETFNISFELASSYLRYLKESYLIFFLSQFSYSLKKQSKALKKVYSIDCGLNNAVSFRFSEDKGRTLENIVFLHLRSKEKKLYYYKTADNSEVDFLIKKQEKNFELIQVCVSIQDRETKERETKSLFTAMDELKLKQGLILTEDEEEIIKKDKKEIIVKPVYKWLLERDF